MLALIGTLTLLSAQAQQVPIPTTATQVPGPVPGTAMTKEYVQTVGRMAYLWGWPMVNMGNRSVAFAKLPAPGLIGGILPAAFNGVTMLTGYVNPDQRAVACPNQDVAYGFGVSQLDMEPIVMQVPDFGERFWVYAVYDQRTDEISEMGKSYGTKPGFYLVVGPNWKGETPRASLPCCARPRQWFSRFRVSSSTTQMRIAQPSSR